jgi:hypothetical protein
MNNGAEMPNAKDRLSRRSALMLALTSSIAAAGQSTRSTFPAFAMQRNLHARIVDSAFGRNRDESRNSILTISLLFMPSFHSEREIVIRFETEARVTVEYTAATVAAHTVLGMRNSIPDNEMDAVIRSMKVVRKPLNVEARTVRLWVRDFWIAVSSSASILREREIKDLVQLDGTLYRIEYGAGLLGLNFGLLDSEIGSESRQDLPLVQWANRIHHFVEG